MTERITVEEYRKQGRKALKHGNKIVYYKGMCFRSTGECLRYKELELLEIADEIRDLKRQTRHNLISDGMIVGTYTDDFAYFERVPNSTARRWVIEDFKGYVTDLFRLKWNIMHSMYQERLKIDDLALRITKKSRRRS